MKGGIVYRNQMTPSKMKKIGFFPSLNPRTK